jgi:hypothetical protein
MEDLVKDIKRDLFDYNCIVSAGYDNGEIDDWNFQPEINGDGLCIIVYIREIRDDVEIIEEEVDDDIMRSNYITYDIKEFLKTPWREIVQRINLCLC